MHTCVKLGFYLKTPLGGPMSSQTIPNDQKIMSGNGWRILIHKYGILGMGDHMGEWESL